MTVLAFLSGSLRPGPGWRTKALAVAALMFAAPLVWAGFDRGLAAYMEGDYKTAFQEMQDAAQKGDAAAQNNLAVLYSTGRGTQTNGAKAREWWRKAAEQGNDEAAFNLGLALELGQGLPQDDSEAALWYRRSADSGNPSAQYNLGLLQLRRGDLFPNTAEALQHLRDAAEQDHLGAQKELALRLGQIGPDLTQSAQWYRAAADQGDAESQRILGAMYANGVGLTADDRQAAYWYERAALQGDYQAQINLGRLYADGKGVAAAPQTAYQWFGLATAQAADPASRTAALIARDQQARTLSPAQIDALNAKIDRWRPRDPTFAALTRPTDGKATADAADRESPSTQITRTTPGSCRSALRNALGVASRWTDDRASCQ